VTPTQGSRCAATLGYGRFPLQGMALADGDVRSSCGNFRLDEHGVFDPGGLAAHGDGVCSIQVAERTQRSAPPRRWFWALGRTRRSAPPRPCDRALATGVCAGAHTGGFDPGLGAARQTDPLQVPTQRSGHRGPPPRRPGVGPLRTVPTVGCTRRSRSRVDGCPVVGCKPEFGGADRGPCHREILGGAFDPQRIPLGRWVLRSVQWANHRSLPLPNTEVERGHLFSGWRKSRFVAPTALVPHSDSRLSESVRRTVQFKSGGIMQLKSLTEKRVAEMGFGDGLPMARPYATER